MITKRTYPKLLNTLSEYFQMQLNAYQQTIPGWGSDSYFKDLRSKVAKLEDLLGTPTQLNYDELAIIWAEFEFVYDGYSRLNFKQQNVVPYYTGGARGLKEILKGFQMHPCNFEQIEVVMRGHLIWNSSNSKDKTINELRSKDAKLEKYKITGLEAITLLLKPLLDETTRKSLDDLIKFEKINSNDRKEHRSKDIKPYLRKHLSKSLYRYLTDRFPDHNQNQLFRIGGYILALVGLMPTPKRELKSDILLDQFYIKNFRNSYRAEH